MSDKDVKSGSDSDTSGVAAAQPNVAEPKAANKIAKMSMDQAYAEIENYKRVVEEKNRLIEDLTAKLNEANNVLESQEKGRLIGEILPRSTFKIEELAGKTVEELKSIRATMDLVMPPKVNSVRFGVAAADLSDRERGLTVGDLSWSTAQKRKRAS